MDDGLKLYSLNLFLVYQQFDKQKDPPLLPGLPLLPTIRIIAILLSESILIPTAQMPVK
jgi:hypothetical protein